MAPRWIESGKVADLNDVNMAYCRHKFLSLLRNLGKQGYNQLKVITQIL